MRAKLLAVLVLSMAGVLLPASPRPARAQGAPGPFYRLAERLDEWQLRHDRARLQQDIERGDAARAGRDLEKIRRDEWWLMIDRNGRWYGPPPPLPMPGQVPPMAAFVPHPQYPGYGYDPSNPSRLVPLPRPAIGVTPAPAGAATSPDGGSGSTPGAATSGRGSVVILNPEQTKVAVRYVVDGVTYTTESGGHQRVPAGRSATIAYDRGGPFGVQRYTLSPGVYEFRASDKGWALVRLGPTPE